MTPKLHTKSFFVECNYLLFLNSKYNNTLSCPRIDETMNFQHHRQNNFFFQAKASKRKPQNVTITLNGQGMKVTETSDEKKIILDTLIERWF